MARRKRRQRDADGIGLSFLDAICCGFGAIVLLLVLTKTAEPTIVEDRGTGMEAMAEELASRLPDLTLSITSLQQKLADEQERLAQARQRVAKIAPAAASARAAENDNRLDARAAATIETRLAVARQELTEEMQRLLASQPRPRPNAPVGGIPVDSEYIIFIIDTSGSMQSYAWPHMLRKLEETLNIYPGVKGIQVMNDMGGYLFSSYAGKWIPDTPARRKIILEQLRSWQPFSNSSPVEGITRAIQTYGRDSNRVSIYVFGDEFTGPSIQQVLDTVSRLNRKDSRGRPRVRIHSVGFPVQFAGGGARPSGVRFATLMRTLCYENGGTFVGLQGLR